jgi:D-sedoheptulose 7-phosphate isomerase
MKSSAQNIFNNMQERYPALAHCKEAILKTYEILLNAARTNGTILVCGNGGSAADAEHIVGELMKGFRLNRPIDNSEKVFLKREFPERGEFLSKKLQGAIPALSLTSSTSAITAILNDTGGDFIFAQQVYGYCKKNDALLTISTSGNSLNCVYAAMVAKLKGCPVVALTGEDGGELAKISDAHINVPAKSTHQVQELHLPIYHALCAMLEAEIFSE